MRRQKSECRQVAQNAARQQHAHGPPKPVSYTHLDVYKRQPFDSADAVSYGDDGLPLNAQGEPVFRPDDTPVYEQDGTCLLYTSRCV